MTKNDFIFFDFDGVVVDSFRVTFEIHKTVHPHLTEDSYRACFEGNINDWKELNNTHTKECGGDADFFKEYAPRMKNEVKVFPDMTDVIVELGKHYTLIVISSTTTASIQEFLKMHNLENHFIQIMGNDIHKSKVEKIKMVFEQYDIGAQNCVFVTDTLGDIREAEKMGVGSVGVTWGFHNPETLHQGKPFRLIEQPNQLSVAISDYFNTLK